MDTSTSGAARLYLDIMKKTLSYSLWPEPPVPIETMRRERNALARLVVNGSASLLRRAGLQLVGMEPHSDQDREEGRYWPRYAHTMIGMKRLDNIQSSAESVIREEILGDFIETGVWRGGACIFMRAILAAYGIRDRRVFVADSFQGLPPPDEDRYPADKGYRLHTMQALAVSRESVENHFRQYGLLDDRVVFLQGWFKDTLPAAPIEKLALMRLDGDMYQSTMEGLIHLYPKLSAGGYCIVDDYALPACRQAVEDFRSRHKIACPIQQIDWTGACWRKDL